MKRKQFLASLLLALPLPVWSQSYLFTKIVDGTTQRPDGLGPFNISYGKTTPGHDGKWIVFRDPGILNDGGSHAAIWSYNSLDGSFRKLISFETSLPSGAKIADIQLSDTAPFVRGGTMVFLARDSTSGPNRQGLYSMPAGGGAVVKIADFTTPDPSGGTFTVFDISGNQMGGFWFDGSTVAFNANGSGLAAGNYSAKPDGSAIALLADSLHAFQAQGATVMNFSSPSISGNNAVMFGSGAVSPTAGYNGIYLATLGGNGTVTELVNSSQTLPGITSSTFHTRFDAPVLGVDGTLVVFRADDVPSGLFGLYSTDLTSHVITKIIDSNSTLPGLGKLTAIADGGVSVNQGYILFRAADNTGKSALYTWKSGVITRVIGTGDTLPGQPAGQPVRDVGDPAACTLYASNFAFNVDFGTGSRSLYLARTINSVPAASYVVGGSGAPGSILSGFGQWMTSASLDAPPPYNNPPTTLGNTTVTVKDSTGVERQAQLTHVDPNQINYIVPDATALGASTVTVTSGSQVTAIGSAPIAQVAPALFAANANGKGPAAGGGLVVAPDQTMTQVPINSCGTGGCVTTPIDLGPAGTKIVVSLYGTGVRNRSTLGGVSVTVGGANAGVEYAGSQNQYAGLDQVNIALPRTLAGAGEVDVVLTVDGKTANTVRLNIK
jgi:uncharacterized protein (TIGR03437 family)